MAITKLVREEVHAFVVRCMTRVGTSPESANSLADVIVAADERGIFSHGLNRLDVYVEEVKTGICDGKASPNVIKETPATAYVAGNNAIGTMVGQFCMNMAIAKAKQVGVAWVTCKGSNNYGMACYYTLKAADQGLIGMTMANTAPLIVPTGAKQRALGTNPISVAAPGNNGDSFVLDMATSAVAYGKVELMERKQCSIPNGWGVDSDGMETNDPAAVLQGGGLMPMASFKGSGLAMMIDIMCGTLSGGPTGLHLRKWKSNTTEANRSQTFVALDPNVFATGFEGRLQTFIDDMRGLPSVDPSRPMMIAGDPEKCKLKSVKENGGISYDISLIIAMMKLAAKLEVEPMKLAAKLEETSSSLSWSL